MSLDQKIGQLFVAPACPMRKDHHKSDLLKLLEKYHVGSVIVKQSDPETQRLFLDQLQKGTNLPLLVTADAEWGLAMRMTGTIAYPRNMTLGAIQDLRLIEELGAEIGRQAKLVGVHLNLAPVADVNNNPLNPIIGMRSFGDNPTEVASRVAAYVRGLQSSGVFACVKHMPGHGDTRQDSHQTLPTIPHDRERLDQVELVPFNAAVDAGVACVMTAHLDVPAIDPHLPTSLSSLCTDMIRNQLHFDGLIVSDALNMKALSERYTPEHIAFLARLAGCELLLYGDHIAPNIDQIIQETIPRGFEALKQAYVAGDLNLKELDQTVLKILLLKQGIETECGDLSTLNSPAALDLKSRLFQEAVTLIGENRFPIPSDTALISFGPGDVFATGFSNLDPDVASTVVIAIHQPITAEVLTTIEKYRNKAIVCHFISPYALTQIDAKSIVVAYENDPDAQKGALNVLLGKNPPTGRLPLSLPQYPSAP